MTEYVQLIYGNRKRIRLHPATPYGNVIHRLFGVLTDERVALTVCGVRFAWGSWRGSRAALSECVGCWT